MDALETANLAIQRIGEKADVNHTHAGLIATEKFSSADVDWSFGAGTSGADVNEDGSFSLPGSGYMQVTADISKSGYTPVGIIGIQFGGGGATSIILNRYYTSGNQAVVLLRNYSGNATNTLTMTAAVLYAKN